MIGNSYCPGTAIKTEDGRRATILDRLDDGGLIELVIHFDRDSIVDGCTHAVYWPRRSQIWDMRLQTVDVTSDYMDLLSRQLRQAVKDGKQVEADQLMKELTDARQRWLDAQCTIFGVKPNG